MLEEVDTAGQPVQGVSQLGQGAGHPAEVVR